MTWGTGRAPVAVAPAAVPAFGSAVLALPVPLDPGLVVARSVDRPAPHADGRGRP